MRIKVRGYEGVLINLDSVVDIFRDVTQKRVRVIRYCVTIICDDEATVKLDCVKPNEIEVINEL